MHLIPPLCGDTVSQITGSPELIPYNDLSPEEPGSALLLGRLQWGIWCCLIKRGGTWQLAFFRDSNFPFSNMKKKSKQDNSAGKEQIRELF